MPSEITSFMVAAISKKRRMPDGGMASMRLDTKLRISCFLVAMLLYSTLLHKAYCRGVAHVDTAKPALDPCVTPDQTLPHHDAVAGCALVNDRVGDNRIRVVAASGDFS